MHHLKKQKNEENTSYYDGGCVRSRFTWVLGCGGIDEDPDAAANEAKEAKPNPGDDDPDAEDDESGEEKFTPKSKDDPDDDDGDDE